MMPLYRYILIGALYIALHVPSLTLAKDTHMPDTTKKAIFAGGCFWCMEAEFEALEGVSDAISGYAGGKEEDADYERVSRGGTRHREAVKVYYDPAAVNYERLLNIYLDNVDPFDKEGQFCDKGFHYTPAIYTATEAEHTAAAARLEEIRAKTGQTPVIALEKATTFFPAEDYHQNFHRKQRLRYTMYKNNCGRKERLKDVKDMFQDD